MLRRALSNLLSNAIKYGKPDSVIKINCQQNIDTTIFTIENESSPITPEQLNRLFDRFTARMHPDKELRKAQV